MTDNTDYETQDFSMQPFKRARSGSFVTPKAGSKAPFRRGYKAQKKTNLQREVKKIVSRLSETKKAFYSNGDSLVKFNSGINSAGDRLQLCPNVNQGTDEGQRIGNQIRAHSLRVKGYVKLDINDVDDSTKLPTVACRMMIVSMKTRPCFFDATGSPGTLATLLEKGQTTVGFTGVLSDLHAPINTDVYTVHQDEVFYLNQDYLNVIGAAPPSQRVSVGISNTVKFFDFNVKCKNKLLRYDVDVGSGLFPTNFGPFMVLGYSYLDGSAPDVLDTKLGLQYDTVLTYEDA